MANPGRVREVRGRQGGGEMRCENLGEGSGGRYGLISTKCLNKSVQQSDQVMTEKEYYLQAKKFNNWCIYESAAAFVCKNLYCCFCFLVFAILF